MSGNSRLRPRQEIIKLGNSLLYYRSRAVKRDECDQVEAIFAAMKNVLDSCRRELGFGRAIAAVQVGVLKRMILIDFIAPLYIINPQITYLSPETFELWDDCLSFPGLLVRVRRHQVVRATFYNQNWEKVQFEFKDDLAELFQHEFDHLNGILAINRAINRRSFALTGEVGGESLKKSVSEESDRDRDKTFLVDDQQIPIK